jgi:hypothetical protein
LDEGTLAFLSAALTVLVALVCVPQRRVGVIGAIADLVIATCAAVGIPIVVLALLATTDELSGPVRVITGVPLTVACLAWVIPRLVGAMNALTEHVPISKRRHVTVGIGIFVVIVLLLVLLTAINPDLVAGVVVGAALGTGSLTATRTAARAWHAARLGFRPAAAAS